jgi:TfoX/Sxy family transcriptional regulator of competence genes
MDCFVALRAPRNDDSDRTKTQHALGSKDYLPRSARLDPDFIHELFAAFRPVTVRRMFGGAGIFCDGLMFALVFDGAIYFKVDDASIPDFEREGSTPFVYTRAKSPGRVGRASLAYWGCRSGSTTILMISRSGLLARWPSPSARNSRRAGGQSASDRRSTAAGRARSCV